MWSWLELAQLKKHLQLLRTVISYHLYMMATDLWSALPIKILQTRAKLIDLKFLQKMHIIKSNKIYKQFCNKKFILLNNASFQYLESTRLKKVSWMIVTSRCKKKFYLICSAILAITMALWYENSIILVDLWRKKTINLKACWLLALLGLDTVVAFYGMKALVCLWLANGTSSYAATFLRAGLQQSIKTGGYRQNKREAKTYLKTFLLSFWR